MNMPDVLGNGNLLWWVQHGVAYACLIVAVLAIGTDVLCWELGRPDVSVSRVSQEFFRDHPWLLPIAWALVLHLTLSVSGLF